MNEKLVQATKHIKAGDRKAAHALLLEIIQSDPRSPNAEIAWLWLSGIFNDPIKQRRCLENALNINPKNKFAWHRLSELASNHPQLGVSSENVSSNSNESKNIKKCPYCAETIKADAIVCRFCGKDLRVLPSRNIEYSPPIVRPSDKGIGRDIKDVGKTATGVAFGILSAPFISFAVLVGLIVFCCFGCAFLNSFGSLGEPSQTTSPTRTLIIPPTFTPLGNSASPNSQTYLDRREDITNGWGIGTASIELLIGEVQREPTLWLDEDWLDANLVALTQIAESNELLRTMTSTDVPDNYEESHSELLRTANAYDDLVENYTEWLITGDDYYVQQSTDALKRVIEHLTLSNALMP